MTETEWKTFKTTINQALKTIDTTYPNKMSIWEAAADMHNQVSDDVHWTCTFFWYHRLFVVHMEKKLQALNPDFFFPYWDSARVWDKTMDSVIWKHIGRDGSPLKGDAFNGKKVHGETYEALYREFDDSANEVPSLEMYNSIYQKSLKNGGFSHWAKAMEVQHGYLHNNVGGQMKTMYSPLDPLFYFHHTHLDYVWSQAQSGWKTKGLDISAQVGGHAADGSTCNFKTVVPGFQNTFSDILDISNLCVHYAAPGEKVPVNHAAPSMAHNSSKSASTNDAVYNNSVSVTSLITNSTKTKSVFKPSTETLATTSSDHRSTTSSGSFETTSSIFGKSGIETDISGPFPTNSEIIILGSKSITIDQDSIFSTTSMDATSTSKVVLEPTPSKTISSHESRMKPSTAVNALGDYPPDYKFADKCLPPLPSSWIAMQQRGSKVKDMITILNGLGDLCSKIVEDGKQGVVVPPMPIFEIHSRPIISMGNESKPLPSPISPIPDFAHITKNGALGRSCWSIIIFLALFI